MGLEQIISAIPEGTTQTLMPEHHDSLCRIEELLEYTEPRFKQISHTENSRFMIFSAPGATGKTTLAKYISAYKKGIYWDLSKIFLGEGSFHGNIVKAVGYDRLTEFFKNLKAGKELLVIDAFDESETIAGRKPIEFFLEDLIDVTDGSLIPTVVLLARTETALFMANFLKERHVNYSHYEIGFIARDNAKKLVRNIIKMKDNNIPDSLIEKYITQQFEIIEKLLVNHNDIDSFLGYAPVLEVLGMAFDKESNTMKYLNALKSGATRPRIIEEIMDKLFDREQEKICDALNQKWEKKSLKISWEQIYTKNEQLVYLLEYLIFNAVGNFYQNETIPEELYEEYLESVTSLLRQHPFINCTIHSESEITEFAGPAFRDYSLAFLLNHSNPNFRELVEIYFDESRKKGIHCTSQILFECYKEMSAEISGSFILSYLYDSFRARESATDISHLSIYEYDDSEIEKTDNSSKKVYANFVLDSDTTKESSIFVLTNNNSELSFRQLVNIDIDADYKVIIGGDTVNDTRIYNSEIICKQLEWDADNITLESTSDTEIVISSKNPATVRRGIRPKFILHRNAVKNNIKVDIPNITNYYGLIPYKCDFAEEDINDFNSFACAVRRILICLRSHSKDTPARKVDYIENRIIGKNESKMKVLDFLKRNSILYSDEQDWLYKLDIDKLSAFSVKWNEVKNGILNSLHSLYDAYCKFS